MRTSHFQRLAVIAAILLPLAGFAQVNSGSDGHDGALNPASNLVIDMADHPDGIYHYTSVNIPAGVTVSFIPNAGNKPVVWLVQGDCTINGNIELNGKGGGSQGQPGVGGPGGFAGGNGGTQAGQGMGPGGGEMHTPVGGNGSYATRGEQLTNGIQGLPGAIYGNSFCIPLVGGSGGGGGNTSAGGGGGAILIATSNGLTVNGSIMADGGSPYAPSNASTGGAGSGGTIRLVATSISGSGYLSVNRKYAGHYVGYPSYSWVGALSGYGRVRIDTYSNTFGGTVGGVFTQGFQPIIIPAPGQGIQLAIQSLAGVSVAANPSGVLANPDVIIPAQQANPIPVVVQCTNLPLNTEISVVVHPASGPDVQAVGLNHAGTAASSTATVSLNMPRGGGIIYAKAVTGIAGGGAAIGHPAEARTRSLAETGWTADGERFVKMEITAALGGPQRVAYITASGKRYEAN
jgi:hypothetical protein